MTTEILANGNLSMYIESFWEASMNEISLLAPDGTFCLFHASDSFYHFSDKWKLYPSGVYLTSILTKPTFVYAPTGLRGIRFKSFARKSVYGFLKQQNEGKELVSMHVNFANASLKGFSPDQSLHECIPVLSEIANEFISASAIFPCHLRDKVNYILDRKGQVRLQEMVQTFGISRQALFKSFKVNMGLSPKELCEIWRMNHFLVLAKSQLTLTEASIEAGYYDQAHAIHHFQKMFSIPPSNFMKEMTPVKSFAIRCMKNRFENHYDPKPQKQG